VPALPLAGVDGTLKDRMQKSKAYRNVRAKTGTLTGISSLAGYLTAANGHQFAFCIINQGVVKAKDGKDFQDKVCRYLCE
jgi:D-alanyl-D-alanine carboxypeptidase/D-alanyl-D-alanine-endopeptidase (penicillin-binding protein 4)